jgi:hypothetical protein
MNLLIHRIALLIALNSAFSVAASAAMPNDFAYGMPLQLQSEAAIYNLTVPNEVYQHTLRTDLGDLRIFNGDDEAVTYSISTPAAKTSNAAAVPVPLFPLHGDPGRALDRVKITIASEQGAVNLQTSREPAPAQIQAYVLDMRKQDLPVTALELHWPENAAEFSGHMTVERSDDLGEWSPVASNLPVVNLKFNDQQLLQNLLEFPPTQAKYLRLRWNEQPAPFVINEALAEVAASRTEPARIQAGITGRAATGQNDVIEFALDFHAPIDRINLELPQPNTVATLTLSSRSQPSLPWHDITTMRVYTLQNNGTTLRNAAVMIPANTDRYWRVQTNAAGGMGKGTPVLQVAWLPQEITFVARGREPFQLAFGSVSEKGATTPLQNLLADPRTPISVGIAAVGALHELGGTTRLVIKRELPWKTWALWAVLIAAVGALGAAAYRLSREMSK